MFEKCSFISPVFDIIIDGYQSYRFSKSIDMWYILTFQVIYIELKYVANSNWFSVYSTMYDKHEYPLSGMTEYLLSSKSRLAVCLIKEKAYLENDR